MSDIHELGVDEQLTRKVRNITMMSEFEMSDQPQSRSTRRAVVATGAKLAYTVPIVAASLKVSTLSAFAAVTGGGLICDDDSSPKQCPENEKVQFVCKGPGSACPEAVWGIVQVLCTDDGPICIDKFTNLPLDCKPVQCANLAD